MPERATAPGPVSGPPPGEVHRPAAGEAPERTTADRPGADAEPVGGPRESGPAGAARGPRRRWWPAVAGALLAAAVAGAAVSAPWRDDGSGADPGPAADPDAESESGGADGGADGESGPPAAERPDAVPLDWTVRPDVWPQGCGHTYLVDREPAVVPAPPVAQDAERWVTDNDAVHGGASVVEATLRTNGGGPVVVEALHVRVVDRSDPLDGPVYATGMGCGGALSLAAFRVDLDETAPRARPTEGFDGESGEALPAPRLPFQVSDEEPLAVRVEAAAEDCDCAWYLEAEWSSGTERGTVRLDRDGQPFRTSGIEGNPRFVHDGAGWTPLVP